jgi:isopenicillin N synthase-like dioxygenase
MLNMERFGLQMLPLYAVALQLPADHFAPFFDGGVTTVRMIHYPPAGLEDEAGNVFGTAPHTDRNFSTFLAQVKVPSLQILTTGGE